MPSNTTRRAGSESSTLLLRPSELGNQRTIILKAVSVALLAAVLSFRQRTGLRLLTVVVDGVGDDGVERLGVLAALILQVHLDAEAHHVQVVLLGLQQLLPRH